MDPLTFLSLALYLLLLLSGEYWQLTEGGWDGVNWENVLSVSLPAILTSSIINLFTTLFLLPGTNLLLRRENLNWVNVCYLGGVFTPSSPHYRSRKHCSTTTFPHSIQYTKLLQRFMSLINHWYIQSLEYRPHVYCHPSARYYFY